MTDYIIGMTDSVQETPVEPCRYRDNTEQIWTHICQLRYDILGLVVVLKSMTGAPIMDFVVVCLVCVVVAADMFALGSRQRRFRWSRGRVPIGVVEGGAEGRVRVIPGGARWSSAIIVGDILICDTVGVTIQEIRGSRKRSVLYVVD